MVPRRGYGDSHEQQGSALHSGGGCIGSGNGRYGARYRPTWRRRSRRGWRRWWSWWRRRWPRRRGWRWPRRRGRRSRQRRRGLCSRRTFRRRKPRIGGTFWGHGSLCGRCPLRQPRLLLRRRRSRVCRPLVYRGRGGPWIWWACDLWVPRLLSPWIFHRHVLAWRILAWRVLASLLLRIWLFLVPPGAAVGVCHLLVQRHPVLLRQRRLLHLEPRLRWLHGHRSAAGGRFVRRRRWVGIAASGCGRYRPGVHVPEERPKRGAAVHR